MAVWKKVIVSGSQAELAAVTASIALKVGSNQIITTAQSSTQLTGSFTGSFKGDGSGLTGVSAQVNNSLTFGEGLGSTPAGTTSFNGSAAVTITVSGSVDLTNNIVTKWDNTANKFAVSSITDDGTTVSGATSLVFSGANSKLTGSFNGTFTGSISASALQGAILNSQLQNSSVTIGNTAVSLGGTQTTFTGLTSVTSTNFVGNLTGSAATASYVNGNIFGSANPVTSASFATTASFAATAPYSGLTGVPSGIVSGSSLSSPSQGQVTLTTNNVAQTVTNLGLQTSDSPTFAGATISTNALAVNNTNGITTNAATFPIAPSAATINIGTTANTYVNIGTTTSTVTIPGNLNVQGSTTIISSSNLTVSDKFVFISSGSTASTNEGGIIVSNASGQTGSAIFYDGTDTRWGLAPAVGATDTGATANSYIVSVSGSSADPTGNPTYGGSTLGYGNMSINTTSGDIWIFA